MKVDILHILSKLDNYVVLRASDIFPNVAIGGDIDILVDDRAYAEKILVAYFLTSPYPNIEVEISQNSEHTHLDIINGKNLICRFDLIDSFNFLSKIHVNHSLTTHILGRKEIREVNGHAIFFPSKMDDLLVRYIEYIEYFSELPTKEKHIEYIFSHCEGKQWSQFFEHVQRYTKLIHDQYQNGDFQLPRDKTIWQVIYNNNFFAVLKKYIPKCVKKNIKRFLHIKKTYYGQNSNK